MSFTAYLWTLFTSAFVSSTVLPGGSEALVVYGMHEFQTQLWVVVFVATAGNTLGALVTYGMGRLIPNKKALFNHLGDFGRTFQKGTSSSIEAPFRA